MLTFSDLITEVKRRAVRDQSGGTFTDMIKNAINAALFRLSREAAWRPLRRKSYFTTVNSYTKGSGGCIVVNTSSTITVTSATFVTDTIKVGRRIKMSGSADYYTIRTINNETILTLDHTFDGTSASNNNYEILPQEEYNLPIQAGHRAFLWHEDYGYPYKMFFVSEQDFFDQSININTKGTPTHYRMWGEDMTIDQPPTDTAVTVYSSSSSDTSTGISVFGTVSNYPDYEVITTNASNGTTHTTGNKLFSSIDRIAKNYPTTGRITCLARDSTTNLAVLPVGDTTSGVMYKKVQLYPLPTNVFPINIRYYKDPYRLVNDGDVHELGQEFDEAIILLSVAKIKAETSQAEAVNFYSLYQDELRILKKTNADKPDWMPTLRRPRQTRANVLNHLTYSQVGPDYGPSSR